MRPWWSPPTTVRSRSADRLVTIHPDVLTHVSFPQSGEGRFRWFHAPPGPGRPRSWREPSRPITPTPAWVPTREQTIQEGWWGSQVTTEAARQRLGDVALVACDPVVAYVDPADTGPFELVGPARLVDVGGDASYPS